MNRCNFDLRTGFLVLGILLPGVAQPAGVDPLQKALSGKVVSFDAASRSLALHYAFGHHEELRDFDMSGFSLETLKIEGGRLRLASSEKEERPFARLRSLHFERTFALELEVTPQWHGAGLLVGLMDSVDQRGQTWIFFNGKLGPQDSRQWHAILRSAPDRRTLPIDQRIASVEPQKTYALRIELEAGALSVFLDGRLLLTYERFPHRSFEVALGPLEGAVEIPDLKVRGQLVESSLRKLLKGREAEAEKERRELGVERMTAMEALISNRLSEPLPREARRAFSGLEPKVRALVVRARKAESFRSLESAARLYERASVLEPENAHLLWRAAWALQFVGEHQEAIRGLTEALRLEPDLSYAWRELGSVFSLLERASDAEEAFAKALACDQEDPLTHALRGRVRVGRGDVKGARADFEMAISLAGGAGSYRRLLDLLEQMQAAPKWEKSYKSASEHYTVETNVGEEFAQRSVELLGRYRQFLETIAPLPETASKEPSRVWIFDSKGGYDVYAGTLMSRSAERTAGVYHPGIKTLLLYDDVNREATYDTLFHEAFHQYLDRVNPQPPIWFNEGMAEFFGAVRINENGQARVGPQINRIRELRFVLLQEPERIPDLDDFIVMPKVDFYQGEDISLRYAVAWSLCHFFLLGPDEAAREHFTLYAQAVYQGKTQDEAYAASFGAPKGKKAESFRRAWLRYCRFSFL